MERRQDSLFRQVVAQVEAGLTDSGFRLFDRGWLGEYRWVEFARLRWDAAERPREEHLVLYHLADHRHIGARIHSRNFAERARSGDVIMNLWDYEPSTMEGHEGQSSLGADVRGWVADALAPAS
jgi:hypothetical protein